jgi:Uma2 family endonuclease
VDSPATLPTNGLQAELIEVPDGYELVDGQLVEKKMGTRSNVVSGNIYAILRAYVREKDLGWALPPDTTFRMPGGRTARKPDASFVRKGRIEDEDLPEGDLFLAPDLAIESISPNDTAYEVNAKVEEYLAVGVRLVWVIDPQTRIVFVHRADKSIAKVYEGQELDGEDVVPGFRCPLTAILLPPSAPKKKKDKGGK